ncbi:MAG: putative repeat protein (TIGR01451 family) [Kiritimatiellia bacterium]|jgi:uncharacterized repeat protein (TIGR01451 family)
MSNRFTTYCTLLLMLLGSLRAFAQVDLTLGDLPAGETVTVVFEVTVDRLQTQTAITNQATVSSENLMDVLSDDPDTGALLDATITAIDAFADVGVDVIPAENPVDASSLVLLDLLVSNAGPHDTTGVVVTNQLPIGVTFDAANSSSNIVELGGGLLEIVLGDLAADAMTNLTIQVSIDDCCQAGFLTNRAGVVHLVTDTNAVNDTHTLAVAVLPDTVPPVITACLTNLFFGCNPGEGTIPEPSPSEIMATDTCGPVTTLFVGEVLSTNGCLVTLTRTYAAVDRCNNSNTCEQLLTWIEDFDAPTFAQCAPDEDLGCNPSIIPPADTNAVAATDACGGVAISLFSEETVTNGCDVVLTRVYMAFDDCGNSSTCTQVVNWVEDLEPPTMNGCPPGMDLGCNPQEIPAPDPSSLGAFDSCGAVAITNIDVLETNGCKVALTRTYVVTDMCGNSNTCSHVLSWSEDTEAPQFTSCAPDMDLGCNPTNIPSADLMAVIATDNCGISDVVLDDETIVTNGFAVMLTRTYLATDGCGNSNTCLQTITWRQDFDAPEIIEFVQDLDLGCNPTNIPPADTNAVVAIDVYGVATVLVLDEVTTTNGCEVTMLRTYQVLDACGNSSNRVQTISWVEDLLPPVIAACPEPIDLGCNPAIPAIPAMDTNLVSATDDCGDVSVSLFSEATATNGCDVTFTRTYLVTDACGNTNSCDEIFTYREDLEAPVITRCAPDMDLGCNPTNIPPADPLSVVATDNCGVSDISLAGEVLSTNGCQMSLSRTYLVLDGCGNSNVCVQTLTWIEDLEAPSVTSCPADVDLGCNPIVIPPGEPSEVIASDTCSAVTVVVDAETLSTNGCQVSLSRSYLITDDCGNATNCVQVLTWTEDLDAPVIEFCPQGGDLGCNATLVPPADLQSVVAFDACGSVAVSVAREATVTNGCLVTFTRTYLVTDDCGNTNACDQVFFWTGDTEPPMIVSCAPDMSFGCNPSEIPPADTNLIAATDNCGVASIFVSGESLSTNGCMVTLSRTFVVFDTCGNSNSCVQALSWTEDLDPPALTECPADENLGCNPTLPTPDVSLVSAEDDCGSVVVVHESDLSVTNGCTVTLTRTYRAFDPCSNSVACVQVLTYTNDLANPVFASAPDFVTVAADENCIGIIPDVLSSVVASDDCGTVMLSQSPAAGSPVQGLEVPDIVVTATDVCGNASITNIAVVVDCLAGLSLVKQVYVGHDAGASCSGQSLIIGTNNTPITFCFTLENTGTVHLANLVLEDALLPGFVPITIDTLAVGASTSVYYETVIAGSVTNLAMATGVPAYVADPLNLNGARARPSNILPGPNVVAMGAAVVLARGQISDTVWLDVNRDGIPNENLDGMGLAGVTVNLYTLNLRGVRTFVTNTMTQAVPGNGGFYLFTNLVAATYLVEIDGNTLPPIFRFPTRPASQVFVMAAGQVVANADFGFISTPTAITLASFDAQAIPAGIQVDWATGSERNNLGFNIYRSQTINGLRTRMNSDLISGQGTGVGARYGLLDAVTETGTYFYWLEDVDYDEQSKLHGPVTATIAATPQVLDAGRVGIHRAPAGIVKIDGQAVPVILTDDGVLFYLADATAEVTLSEGAPDVMSLVDASPDGGEALQLIIAENGLARFTTETGFTVYLVIGFEAAPIVLDVSDPLAPIQVNGAVLERAEETGVYLSYPAAAELNAEVVK